MWTHGFLFYSVVYNPLLPCFILLLKLSQTSDRPFALKTILHEPYSHQAGLLKRKWVLIEKVKFRLLGGRNK